MGLTEKAFSFRDTMKQVLNDIARWILQTFVTNKITKFIGDFFVGQMGVSTNPMDAFAKGGIVNSPTTFSNSGKPSIMGEAGPEAIMPLFRSGGVLGVKSQASPVTVNVQNNTNSDIEVQQNGDTYEIIVSRLSREIQRGTGPLPQSMEARYGLSK